MKSIYETLAALGTGAILMSACGGAAVKATEVPAATDSKPAVAVDPHAVGAVLSYRFDAKTGDHILRLLHPEAHLKRARAQRSGG